jgi:amidase
MPVAEPVRATFMQALALLREAGVQLVEAAPDFTGADECFQVLRGEYFVEMLGDLYRTERARMKDTVVWNVEYGLSLSAQAIAHASLARTAIFERVRRFVAPFDAWLLPTAQVLPFSIDVPYPTEIDGRRLDTYIDWLKSCYWVSASGHPAISVPGGFSSDSGPALPVGLQLVGHWGRDEALMDVAQTVETLLAALTRRQCPPPAA